MTTAVSTRDHTKTRAYHAEWQLQRMLDRQLDCPTVVVAGSTITLPAERKFGDLESIQRYVDAVLALPSVQARWPERAVRPVRVQRRPRDDAAHYRMGVIAIPDHGRRWAMREVTVLHELAHHLDDSHGPAHGKTMQATLVDLLAIAMGDEVGFLMRVLYHQHNA